MSLDNTRILDAIGTEEESSTVVLTIVDSWDWKDEKLHLEALQKKLNSYFTFVESGEIFDSYPEASGKKLRIDVIGQHQIPQSGLNLLKMASDVATELQIIINHRVQPL